MRFYCFLLQFILAYDKIDIKEVIAVSFLFSKCTDAIQNAMQTRTYGAYYSEMHNADLSIHVHDCCEVLLCLAGGSSLLIDGKIYNTKNGDLFFINQFEPHKIIANANHSFPHFALQIHPEYLRKNSTKATDLSCCFYARGKGSTNRLSLTDSEMAEIEHLFLMFRANKGYGDDILKNSAANNILSLVNRFFLQNRKHESEKNTQNEAIKEIVSYINAHFNEDLTLDKLAKEFYISVNQLCKLFKSHADTTVAKYIISKRICEAKRLLAQGNNVAETAIRCGFSDYANFIRVFKKFVGISPGKYNKL